MANYVQKFQYYSNVLLDFKVNASLSTVYTIEGYNIYKLGWIDPNKTYEYGTEIPVVDKLFAIPTTYDEESETYTEQDKLYNVSTTPSIAIGVEQNVTQLVKQVYWIDDSYDPTLPSLNKLKIGQTTYNVKDTFARNAIIEITGGGTGNIKADKVAFETDNPSFKGGSVDDALEQILNKLYYVVPTAPSVTLNRSGSSAIADLYVGDTIPSQTWTYSGNVKITSTNQAKGLGIASVTSSTLTLTDTEKATLKSGTGTNVNFEYTQTVAAKKITEATTSGTFGSTVSLTATTETEINPNTSQSVPSGNNAKKTATQSALSYKAYYPFYIGTIDSPTDEIDLSKLTKAMDTSATEVGKYTANGKYLVFITNRTLKSILDPNKFENLSDFEANKKTVTVTLGGTDYTFNCYITSTIKTCTDFEYQFIA